MHNKRIILSILIAVLVFSGTIYKPTNTISGEESYSNSQDSGTHRNSLHDYGVHKYDSQINQKIAYPYIRYKECVVCGNEIVIVSNAATLNSSEVIKLEQIKSNLVKLGYLNAYTDLSTAIDSFVSEYYDNNYCLKPTYDRLLESVKSNTLLDWTNKALTGFISIHPQFVWINILKN